MIESRDNYGYIDKEEKDITIFKEQKTEGIEKQGLKFPFWQGISQFRRYKRKKLRDLREDRVKIFKSLKSIDSDFKSLYFHKFLRKEYQLIKVDLSETIFLEYGDKFLCFLSYLVPALFLLYLSLSNKEPKSPMLESIGINLAYGLAVVFLSYTFSVMIDHLPFLWGKNKYKKISKAILLPFVSTSIIFVTTFGLIFENYTNNSSFLILVKGVIALGWALSTMISPLLLYLILLSDIFFTQYKRRYPESMLVRGLLEILLELENKSHLWVRQDFRKQIWLKLKFLAFNLQYSSKGYFNSNKPYKAIGSALYNYEPWLQEPRAHTYEDFKARIIKNLRYSITGCIGEIEQSETKIKKLVEFESILARSIPLFLALLLPLWVLLAWEFLQRIPVISITPDLTKIKDQLIAFLVIFAPFLAYGGELRGKIADKLLGLLPGSK
jgi:hypothetical protein